jgi:hypothetical protein
MQRGWLLHPINETDLQQQFDACIGKGDDSGSPILRLARKIAPEWVYLTRFCPFLGDVPPVLERYAQSKIPLIAQYTDWFKKILGVLLCRMSTMENSSNYG